MRQLMGTLLRHLVPIGVTTVFLFIVQLLPSLLILAVFFIDDAIEPAFGFSDLLNFVFVGGGRAFLISVLIAFPLALLFERLAAKSKLFIVVIPASLLVCSLLCLAASFVLDPYEQLRSLTVFLLVIGLALIPISGIFGVYWLVLWFERAILFGFRSALKRISSG